MTNEQAKKMKRCEFFIICNNGTGTGNTAMKTKGYMFEKSGHWFTVRRRMSDEKFYRRKWIVSDFVTGLAMTDTDKKLQDIPSVISEAMIARLFKMYRNNTASSYKYSSIREQLQTYAQMINSAMFKDNPESKMIDLFQSQCYELFN